MKYFDVKTKHETYHNCFFRVGRYVENGSIALYILNRTLGPVARITVCIPDASLRSDETVIDANNCYWALDFMREYGFGEETGQLEPSGYCLYPVMRLDIEKIKEYVEEEN